MNEAPIEALRRMGRELGGPWWVQGPGGNVSVKTTEGELWIKASGVRLTQVGTDQGHARVPLDLARRALGGDAAADGALFARQPRPSLETYFHALGPAVVAHTHAIGVLLHACARVASLPTLSVPVVEIPYVRPGRGVAIAIEQAMPKGAEAFAVVLRSHGLVVYARTAEQAVAVSREVDSALGGRVDRESFEVLLGDYVGAEPHAVEGGCLVRVPRLRAEGPPRYLFPDAVVCASVTFAASISDPAPIVERALAEGGRAGVLADADGERVLFAKSPEQLRQSAEVLAAHDWTAARLGDRAEYLAEDEPAAILGMPSEQYRIRLAGGR